MKRKTSTVKKLLNSVLSRLYPLFGKTNLPYLPSKISIESGNICNLRCPLCPTGQHDESAQKGFISFDTFKKVIDEIGGELTMIRLYNWGEPLLNKDLLDMIHYAGLHVIDIKISTNLSMKLEDSRIEELLRSGLKIIYISCNGISENTYRKYHVGGDLTLVMENMKRFIQIKKRLSNCHTKLVWLFHVFKHNEHEVEKAQEVAGKLGIKIKISNMRTDMGKEIFETIDQARERDAAWIPNNPRFRIPFTRQKKKVGCKLPWTETVINWDGRVIPCCAVYNEKFAFGNVHENSFRQIWNNDMYVAARKEILGIKNDKKTICRTCKSTGYLHGE